MRINYSASALALAVGAIVTSFTIIGSTGTAAAQDPATGEAAYAWDGACRKCHEDIHDRWGRTKHARALSRLSGADQQRECVGCHVTGAKTRIEEGNRIVNAGVQCESCHGAAAAHAKDPTVKTGLVRKPEASVCTECHNDRSPHFRGFFYGAMIGMSHPVPK